MKYLWLLFAIAAGTVGVLVSRALGLSDLLTVTIGSVLAFLASFPFEKKRTPKVRFLYWVIAAVLSTVFAWVLYFGVTRFGG